MKGDDPLDRTLARWRSEAGYARWERRYVRSHAAAAYAAKGYNRASRRLARMALRKGEVTEWLIP